MFNLTSCALCLALCALNLNSSFILIMEWTGYWGNFKSESNTFDGKFVWKQLCTSKGNRGPTTCTHTKVQTGNPHRGVWMIDIRELVWFGAESAMWAIYAFPIFSLRKFISQSIFMSKIRNCFVFDSILIGMMRFDWPSRKVSFCKAFMCTHKL